ncbi:MAG TPA: hypothetical protein ENN18_08835 [Proteobacteria bacterium]|nr:hypothetical protein [Pseudomonadota bacterium]
MSMINALFLLLPENAWVLMLILASILMIIGFRKAALGLVGSVCLLALLGPLVDTFMNALPDWLLVLLLFGFVLFLFRLVLGRRVADNVISFLLYDLIRAPFRLVLWIFRGMRRRA